MCCELNPTKIKLHHEFCKNCDLYQQCIEKMSLSEAIDSAILQEKSEVEKSS